MNEKELSQLLIDIFTPIVDLIVNKVADRVLSVTEKQEPKFYTCKEVCAMLHLTRPTLSRLYRSGQLPCIRIDSRVLFDAEMIDRAVREKTVFKYKRSK